jgi:hypothetical protein
VLAACALLPLTACGSLEEEARSTFPDCPRDQVQVKERPDLRVPSDDDFDRAILERQGCGRTTFVSCHCVHGARGGRTSRVICSPADQLVCSRASLTECEKLCASGTSGACQALGAMFPAGERLTHDSERALAGLLPACLAHHEVACQVLLQTGVLEAEERLQAEIVMCAERDDLLSSALHCARALDQRATLPPAVVGRTLQKLCSSTGEHCGEAKDFAEAHASSPH